MGAGSHNKTKLYVGAMIRLGTRRRAGVGDRKRVGSHTDERGAGARQ